MLSNKKRISRIAVKTSASGVGHIVMLVLKIIGTMLLIFMTTGVIFACIFAIYIKTNLMTGLDVTLEDFSLNQTSIVYSVDKATGEYVEIAELQGSENRTWIDYGNIPINVEHAVVAIEDKRFYEHNGVDWFRTVYAFFNMFLSMRDTFGGSTLTQQLIKNLTEDDEVTVQRKLMEIFRALELEKTYSKSDIMEWYLNVAYFGSGQYGIVAAANYYFGKEVSELSVAEIASIISITNNPSIFSPYVSVEDNKGRQENVLYEMYDQGYITYEEYTAAVNEQLVFDQGEDEDTDISSVYSYFVDALIEDVIDDLMEVKGCSYDIAEQLLFNGGYKIYTTMDMGIQAIVDSYYKEVTNFETDSTQQLQSAIVISDPYTGDIVALAGGVGEKTQNRILNRATQSTRPVGSTIKPLSVYSPAMDLGYITPETNIDDSEDVKLTGTTWMTTNDTNTYSGIINIREALRRSVNTVAAQLVDKLTPQVSYNFMIDKLGFTTLIEDDCDFAPMALGQLTNGATAREMAAGYGIFDNTGIYTESRLYSLITDADGNTVFENIPSTNIAISEVTAYWMTDMLEEAVSSGTGTAADLENMPTAGKTGSTTSYYDRWFVGFTPYYVAAVWVGYDNPERISWGGNPAAQTFYTVMSQVHANLEYRDFTVPVNTYQTPVEGVKAVNYTVKGVTKDGVVLYETTTLTAVGKELEITAQPVTGYVLISESPLVKLIANMNAQNNIVTFIYQDENYVEPSPSPSPTPTTTVTPTTPPPTPSTTPSTSPSTKP